MSTTARREALLDELLALFLAEGFRAFTLADLAAHLRCSKSTLYTLGHSKEQLTVNVLVHFFKRATVRVEERIAGETDHLARIATYLRAAADVLRPASPAFMRDLTEQPAAAAVYERNTRFAAARVEELVREGVDAGAFRPVHADFVAAVVTLTMREIQTGEIATVTGLEAAAAYDELAALVLHGIER